MGAQSHTRYECAMQSSSPCRAQHASAKEGRKRTDASREIAEGEISYCSTQRYPLLWWEKANQAPRHQSNPLVFIVGHTGSQRLFGTTMIAHVVTCLFPCHFPAGLSAGWRTATVRKHVRLDAWRRWFSLRLNKTKPILPGVA